MGLILDARSSYTFLSLPGQQLEARWRQCCVEAVGLGQIYFSVLCGREYAFK